MKKISLVLIGATLMLSACDGGGGGGGDTVQDTPQPAIFGGRIDLSLDSDRNPTGLAATTAAGRTVRLHNDRSMLGSQALGAQALDSLSLGGQVEATAVVDTDGSFSMALPAQAQTLGGSNALQDPRSIYERASVTCQTTGGSSSIPQDASVKTYHFEVEGQEPAVLNHRLYINPSDPRTGGERVVKAEDVLVWSSRSGRSDLQLRCTDALARTPPATIRFALQLRAGWNVVRFTRWHSSLEVLQGAEVTNGSLGGNLLYPSNGVN